MKRKERKEKCFENTKMHLQLLDNKELIHNRSPGSIISRRMLLLFIKSPRSHPKKLKKIFMIKQSCLFHQRVKICKSKDFLLIAAMFVDALIYNFNIKARHFSTDKWKVDCAQRSHALCSHALVNDQNLSLIHI